MDKGFLSRLLVTLALAVVATGSSEAIQRLVVEPRMSQPMGVFTEFSPLAPLAGAAVVAGLIAGTLGKGLVLGLCIAAAVVASRAVASWSLDLPYTHDMWVGSPGFVGAAGLEFVVLGVLLVSIVECVVLTRALARRLRLGV